MYSPICSVIPNSVQGLCMGSPGSSMGSEVRNMGPRGPLGIPRVPKFAPCVPVRALRGSRAPEGPPRDPMGPEVGLICCVGGPWVPRGQWAMGLQDGSPGEAHEC